MIRVQSTCASGANAMAVPEWPELAFSGASMAKPRMTLIPNSTRAGSWMTGGWVSCEAGAAWVMGHRNPVLA